MPHPSQIKAIHTLRRDRPELLDDDTYRDFLDGLTGKRSSKDLTDREAGRVILEISRLAGKPRPSAPKPNPKGPVVGRLLREAYTAGWDQPEAPGPDSLRERQSRVRERVQSWLQDRHPLPHPAKTLEAWPLAALQDLLEHLKGVTRAKARWGR